MLDDRGDRMTSPPRSEVNSALDIFVKDMGLVRDAARAAGLSPMYSERDGPPRTRSTTLSKSRTGTGSGSSHQASKAATSQSP